MSLNAFAMDLLNLLNVPERCRIGQRITKKVFLENARATSAEKKLVRDSVKEMTILASFSAATVNIAAYEDEHEVYEEVLMLEVLVETEVVAKRAASILQKSIPYHMVVWLRCGERLLLNLALKQVNQVEPEKRVVGEMLFTDWMECGTAASSPDGLFESLRVEKLPHENLKIFYDGMVCGLIGKQVEAVTGRPKRVCLTGKVMVVHMLEQLREVNEQLVTLYGAVKNETQFNRKVEMNMQIKSLETKRDELQQGLS